MVASAIKISPASPIARLLRTEIDTVVIYQTRDKLAELGDSTSYNYRVLKDLPIKPEVDPLSPKSKVCIL